MLVSLPLPLPQIYIMIYILLIANNYTETHYDKTVSEKFYYFSL